MAGQAQNDGRQAYYDEDVQGKVYEEVYEQLRNSTATTTSPDPLQRYQIKQTTKQRSRTSNAKRKSHRLDFGRLKLLLNLILIFVSVNIIIAFIIMGVLINTSHRVTKGTYAYCICKLH